MSDTAPAWIDGPSEPHCTMRLPLPQSRDTLLLAYRDHQGAWDALNTSQGPLAALQPLSGLLGGLTHVHEAIPAPVGHEQFHTACAEVVCGDIECGRQLLDALGFDTERLELIR